MLLKLKSADECFPFLSENIKIAIPALQGNTKNIPSKRTIAPNKKPVQTQPSFQMSTQYDDNAISEYSFSGKQPKTVTEPGSEFRQVKVPTVQEQILAKQRQLQKIQQEIAMLKQKVTKQPNSANQPVQTPSKQTSQSVPVSGPVNYWSPENVKQKPGMGWGLGNWVRNIRNIPSNFMSGFRGTNASLNITPKTSSAEYLFIT